METKIDLKGIVRNTSNLNSPIGGCQEVINLRKKYGSWRPIMPKHVVCANFTATDNTVFIHSMDEVSYFIIYNPNDGTIKAFNTTTPFAVVETLATIATGLTLKIDSLGYFLVVSDLTAYSKYIFRCYPSLSTKYKNVSDIPSIALTLEPDETVITDFYYTKRDNDSFQAGWWMLEDVIRDTYAEYFEGYVFLRYAIELIDGTVLKHSQPQFMYVGNVTSTDGVDYVTLDAILVRINYTVQAVLPSDWANYAELIRGISVFMTKPVSKYDLELSGFNNSGTYLGLIEKPNLVVDMLRSESVYYRVHHIPYNKILGAATGIIGSSRPIITPSGASARSGATGDGRSGGDYTPNRTRPSTGSMTSWWDAQFQRQEDRKDMTNPSMVGDITSYDILSVDDVSHHSIIGFKSLNYNNRLFFADIYTNLFTGYNISEVILSAGGSAATKFDIYIEVDLATEYGLRTVRQKMKWDEDSFKVPYILGYPDIRAKELRILHNSGGTVKKAVFALESHPILNYCFATKLDGTDLNEAAKDSSGFKTITIASITTAGTLATLITSLRDKNRVQLTDLYNPFVAPAINSYQVGEGDIEGLAVNMLPLEDRFGTYPVFVFSSRGVWALNMSDTGRVVVSNITSVSSAVCTNSDSIIVVDNLLLFLASDGIKLLTGQTPAEISDIAEGSYVSALTGNSVYEQVKSHASIGVVTSHVSSLELLDYALAAKFAFDKNNREVIVSNFSKEYSYIFSLDERLWYKSTNRYRRFINNYPNVFALSSGNDLVDISREATTGDRIVYIETKPILLDPDKEIKLDRTILGGRFDNATEFTGFFGIWGSNDGSTWAFIQGKEISGLSIFNIILPRNTISMRYVVCVFNGTITKDSSVSEIRMVF